MTIKFNESRCTTAGTLIRLLKIEKKNVKLYPVAACFGGMQFRVVGRNIYARTTNVSLKADIRNTEARKNVRHTLNFFLVAESAKLLLY